MKNSNMGDKGNKLLLEYRLILRELRAAYKQITKDDKTEETIDFLEKLASDCIEYVSYKKDWNLLKKMENLYNHLVSEDFLNTTVIYIKPDATSKQIPTNTNKLNSYVPPPIGDNWVMFV